MPKNPYIKPPNAGPVTAATCQTVLPQVAAPVNNSRGTNCPSKAVWAGISIPRTNPTKNMVTKMGAVPAKNRVISESMLELNKIAEPISKRKLVWKMIFLRSQISIK